jgi:hypothetical protein
MTPSRCTKFYSRIKPVKTEFVVSVDIQYMRYFMPLTASSSVASHTVVEDFEWTPKSHSYLSTRPTI